MFGWQGYSIRGKGYIQCLFCRRLVGLWNFKSHNHAITTTKEIADKTKKSFFERPWHNMNLKRLNEILSKRKATEKMENANKKLKTEDTTTTDNDDETKTENITIVDNNDESKTETSLDNNDNEYKVGDTSSTNYEDGNSKNEESIINHVNDNVSIIFLLKN